MPKEERKILQGVQIPILMKDASGKPMTDEVGRQRFTEVRTITDAEELEELATPDQIKRLTAEGAISGFVAGAPQQQSAGEGAFGPGEEKTAEPKSTARGKK